MTMTNSPLKSEIKTSEEIKDMLEQEQDKEYPEDFNEGCRIYEEIRLKQWIPADKVKEVLEASKVCQCANDYKCVICKQLGI